MCCRILIFENQQFHVELWGNKKKWLFLMQKTGLLSPEYFTAMLKFANECKNWPTNFQAEVYHSTLVVYLESRQSSIPCKKARTCKNKNTNMQKEESRSQTSMLCKEEKKEGSLDPACPCPLLKICFSSPFVLFQPLLRYFTQFPTPSRNPLLP